MNFVAGKTVLLTGATGFIGSHLHRQLAALPLARLVLLARKPPAEARKGEVWVACDLDRLSPITWSEHGVDRIDLVFHLGAFTPKSGSEADAFDQNYRANLLGTRSLLESLPNEPDKVVFSSTLDVYQPPAEGQVLTEDSALVPSSLYGASKLFCEHLVEAYARRTGCSTAILRYGHIYGPGEAAYAKLIPMAIRALLNHESPVIYGDGSVLRDFLFVDDAVEATLRAAASGVRSLGPVNIVSGTSRPIREIVELLASFSPDSPPVKYLTDKPGGRSLRFSPARMHASLGEWPLVPFDAGLSQEFAAFQQENASSRR